MAAKRRWASSSVIWGSRVYGPSWANCSRTTSESPFGRTLAVGHVLPPGWPDRDSFTGVKRTPAGDAFTAAHDPKRTIAARCSLCLGSSESILVRGAMHPFPTPTHDGGGPRSDGHHVRRSP